MFIRVAEIATISDKMSAGWTSGSWIKILYHFKVKPWGKRPCQKVENE